MEDVEAIVRGLSRVRRAAIINARPMSDFWSVKLGDEALEELEFMGVTGENGWIDALTPLGQSVRTYLLSQTKE